RVRLMRARRSPSMKDDSGTVWTLSDMVSLRRGRACRPGAHDRKVGRNCCPRGRYNPRRDSLLAAYVAATGMSGLKQTRSFLGDFLEISESGSAGGAVLPSFAKSCGWLSRFPAAGFNSAERAPPLLLQGLGHQQPDQHESQAADAGEPEEGAAAAQPVAHPSAQGRAERGADPDAGADNSLRQIETTGIAGDVGDGERHQHAE